MKVVDASVVAKMLIYELGRDRVKKLLESGERLIVPDILFVEIANVLATKTAFSVRQIEKGLDLVYGMGFDVEETTKNLLIESAKSAKENGTAVYDMIYAMLAKRLGGQLITADKNFAAKTGFDWVVLI